MKTKFSQDEGNNWYVDPLRGYRELDVSQEMYDRCMKVLGDYQDLQRDIDLLMEEERKANPPTRLPGYTTPYVEDLIDKATAMIFGEGAYKKNE